MTAAAPLLLDTCAIIWFADDQPMASMATEAMNQAFASDAPVFISPISAWEVGLLAARGRLRFPVPPQTWFRKVQTTRGVELVELSPTILIESSYLPGRPPKDPADRILAATAREHGFTLVTRDRPLLEYAEQGHLNALSC